MAQQDFFPLRPEASPKIYAYEDTNPQYAGLLKVGYTTVDVQTRVKQQYPTLRPGTTPYIICMEESAMRADGTSFTDHDVHKVLRKRGIDNPNGEWFRCTVRDVKAAVIAVRNRETLITERTADFAMRPEQEAAVVKTADYFRSRQLEDDGKTPHFLWNCKMRFGKTFTAYQLAKRMGWKKVLVLTFKPAVENAWRDDLNSHVDFDGWQFISHNEELTYEAADKQRPIVCFGSLQDYQGKSSGGGIKERNKWVHAINWDCVIFDEYHYGAWRENTKDLFESDDADDEKVFKDYDEDTLPITSNAYLYLSGTPFRAISTGEFIEDQIYNWTYSDEQKAKENWAGAEESNPYASLPRMVLMTYQMPDEIRNIALGGEFNEFDLNVFFSAEGTGEQAEFRYKSEVQKWLDLIRGSYAENIVSELKQRTDKPPMPFSDVRLLGVLTHTLWFLPTVASCYAMRNLLSERNNTFYHDYTVIVAAGKEAGNGMKALDPVRKAMADPLQTKTITLSCGKLTTGVTIKPWAGILMLRNSSSPETYFQAAFRVQSPWTISDMAGKTEILKQECYVFDFAPNRALHQIADYSCRLDIKESNPEEKVKEFINFLPVLAYDGSSMKRIDAAGVLDIAMSGTTVTLLTKRWESAMLVNVDNPTLQRLMASDEAMRALMNIEGFRNLNQDITTIINKSEAVKKAKKEEAEGEELSKEKRKELTAEEKEYKSVRKQIQDKLIKFATRIPVFMYLTDYREQSLKDIIMKLEPDLFRKVTGLTLSDFDLLVSLGVFNGALMNDAVYKFRRYEDNSLVYIGINRHGSEGNVGLYETTISKKEYEQVFVNQ